MSKHRPFVLGSSAAFPEHSYLQQDVLNAVANKNNFAESAKEFGNRVFNKSFTRGNISLEPEELGKKMGRVEYRKHLHDNLLKLSTDACSQAMQDWGGTFGDVTHLVWATMSAVIDAPSMDAILVNHLALKADVRRISVSQQGCMSGFRCLNLAAEICQANPEARVLVCVADVRSGLQNQLPRDTEDGVSSRSSVIACALFRDAASSVVIGARPKLHETPKAEWVRGTSHVIWGTLDRVSIVDNNDASISWYNSKDMPALVTAYTPTIVQELLSGLHLTPQDPQYVIHPGGPAILKGPQELLGLPKEQNQAAWDYMNVHGNTSGSSNLAVLHHELMRSQDPDLRRDWILCLAAGPGIAMEGALLRRINPIRDSCAAACIKPGNTEPLAQIAFKRLRQAIPSWAILAVELYICVIFMCLMSTINLLNPRKRGRKQKRTSLAKPQAAPIHLDHSSPKKPAALVNPDALQKRSPVKVTLQVVEV